MNPKLFNREQLERKYNNLVETRKRLLKELQDDRDIILYLKSRLEANGIEY